ncbi:MAG: hypothetical protein GF384_03525 [Elusimicrobia bacterium]|nr:hypothetical protein [Elusimicrobiota bacterium]MBD3411984.1 hypothetical protein [Elusimicrobiota bacterium]
MRCFYRKISLLILAFLVSTNFLIINPLCIDAGLFYLAPPSGYITQQIEGSPLFQIIRPHHNRELTVHLTTLNRIYQGEGKSGLKSIVKRAIQDSYLNNKISRIIWSQDRKKPDISARVNTEFARLFKEESLQQAVIDLNQRDIFSLQMEYEVSADFLDVLAEHLEKFQQLNRSQAVYDTGEFAKLLMAGGLGSFKPDLVRGWYRILSQYLGPGIARKRLNAVGVLYSEAIKGTGKIADDPTLSTKNIVDVAVQIMDHVATYRVHVNVDDDNGGKVYDGDVEVQLLKNPFSELQEFWMYCPAIFNEAYPGHSNDRWRGVQTYVYRKALLQFIKDGVRNGSISRKILFSTSEVNTTLALPKVINDEFTHDPVFDDVYIHHYNHTRVEAGMPRIPAYMVDSLRLNREFMPAIYDDLVDLAMITGSASDCITGCSPLHTQILADEIFSNVRWKVVENNLFGNGEGSDIIRWQGKELQMLFLKYSKKMNIPHGSYDLFFEKLEKNRKLHTQFIAEMLRIKQKQKEQFIEDLLNGVFGPVFFSREDLKKDKINLLAMPFFTFVRRMVHYKCSDRLIDLLEDPVTREELVQNNAVIIVGGRKFDDFAEEQLKRIRTIIKKDPRMKYHIIYISNHNVFTSRIIQQGTDFGGMLSFKGKEAGPTSFGNAQQNGAPTVASPDGIIPERVHQIVRDTNGRIIDGNGYIVAYEETPGADNEIRPDHTSLHNQIITACQDYQQRSIYGTVSYNALRTGMTLGDIRNQAAGLIMVWAAQIHQKQNRLRPQSKQLSKPKTSVSH